MRCPPFQTNPADAQGRWVPDLRCPCGTWRGEGTWPAAFTASVVGPALFLDLTIDLTPQVSKS